MALWRGCRGDNHTLWHHCGSNWLLPVVWLWGVVCLSVCLPFFFAPPPGALYTT